jgi:hypothetical protein
MAPKRKDKKTQGSDSSSSAVVGSKRSRRVAAVSGDDTEQKFAPEGSNGFVDEDHTVASEMYDYSENPVHSSQFAGGT